MIALVCKFELFLSPDAVFLFSFFVQSPDEGADYNDDIKTSQFFVVVFFLLHVFNPDRSCNVVRHKEAKVAIIIILITLDIKRTKIHSRISR